MTPSPAGRTSEHTDEIGASHEQRLAYERKKIQANIQPLCEHVRMSMAAGSGSTSSLSRSSGALPFWHHAIFDRSRQEVIHYIDAADTPGNRVRAQPADDVKTNFPVWETVAVPSSPEHASEILDRARSKIGERRYDLVTNNCEHFATWCFTQQQSSLQVQEVARSLGVATGTSATAGVSVAAVGAAATTTMTTPAYVLGIIPWGTTTTTVHVMTWGTAATFGGAVFGGALVASLSVGFGIRKWISYGKNCALAHVPICVKNDSDTDIYVQVSNVNKSNTPLGRLDGLLDGHDTRVHRFRACCGVGKMEGQLANQEFVELLPPSDPNIFTEFLLTAFQVGSYTRLCSLSVARGDVLLYRNKEFMQIEEDLLDST